MAQEFGAKAQGRGARRNGRIGLAGMTLALLSACGGGGGEAVQETATATGGGLTGQTETAAAANNLPPTRAEAFRLLTQASFGPTEASLAQVTTQGLNGWIDGQLALPATAAHLPRWRATTKALQATQPGTYAGPQEVVHSFYQQALGANDQLRQRVAYALSEIFVVSTNDLGGERGEAQADFQDMLARNAFGNYRTLLQDVAAHPAMGLYLSHIKNRKADNRGRLPDQNFAREVMQLFSIGLYQLNADGSPRLGTNGLPIETYSASDIEGMAAVFTGFSFGGADTSTQRFFGQAGYRDVNRLARPMQGYPQFHTMTEKRFLGAVVPAQAVADPAASLRVAMDTLFNHPNVGPFIGRQLIQRLVTSQPSPAYVARVAAAFNNNGLGTRGDMKAVVRAVLTDYEARSAVPALGSGYGKLREPVLRLTAFLRAFQAKSESGKVLMTFTDDPATTLGQTPFRSPGVFNFYRPGHVPSSGEASALGMTVPELQTTSESSVAGYANYMLSAVANGVGPRGTVNGVTRPDLQPNYTAEMALAEQPAALTNLVLSRLLPEVPAGLASEITATVSTIAVPLPNKKGTNGNAIALAKRQRVYAAILLALVSPEFIVQK